MNQTKSNEDSDPPDEIIKDDPIPRKLDKGKRRAISKDTGPSNNASDVPFQTTDESQRRRIQLMASGNQQGTSNSETWKRTTSQWCEDLDLEPSSNKRACTTGSSISAFIKSEETDEDMLQPTPVKDEPDTAQTQAPLSGSSSDHVPVNVHTRDLRELERLSLFLELRVQEIKRRQLIMSGQPAVPDRVPMIYTIGNQIFRRNSRNTALLNRIIERGENAAEVEHTRHLRGLRLQSRIDVRTEDRVVQKEETEEEGELMDLLRLILKRNAKRVMDAGGERNLRGPQIWQEKEMWVMAELFVAALEDKPIIQIPGIPFRYLESSDLPIFRKIAERLKADLGRAAGIEPGMAERLEAGLILHPSVQGIPDIGEFAKKIYNGEAPSRALLQSKSEENNADIPPIPQDPLPANDSHFDRLNGIVAKREEQPIQPTETTRKRDRHTAFGLDGTADEHEEDLFEDEDEDHDDPDLPDYEDVVQSIVRDRIPLLRLDGHGMNNLEPSSDKYSNMPGNNTLPRQVPGPSLQQSPQQHQGNGNGGPVHQAQIRNEWPHAGHQTDINYLWSIVQELSEVLAENRTQTAGIMDNVQQIQERARHNGTDLDSSTATSQPNGDQAEHPPESDSASQAAEVALLRSRLHTARTDVASLEASHNAMSRLLDTYVYELNSLKDRIRTFAHGHTSALITTHKQYNELIQQERETSLQLRLEHGNWQEGLERAAKWARKALKERTDETCDMEKRCREVRMENRVLRRLLGWEVTDKGDSDDEEEQHRNGRKDNSTSHVGSDVDISREAASAASAFRSGEIGPGMLSPGVADGWKGST